MLRREAAELVNWWSIQFGHRRLVDRLGASYAAVVLIQAATVLLYEADVLPGGLALAAGLSTALLGPSLSLAVSLHVFAQRRWSKGQDVANVALTYVVTCLSYAILYVVIADHDTSAFGQPPGSAPPLSLGAALYFSLVTITTTGYGDIVPLSGLARAAAGAEIFTGLCYQVFVFSLVASLISSGKPPADT